MYQYGLKVMDNVAENVAEKIQKGEDIDSIIKIFQDWLMTGDEVYGKLFQSDEYSKLMTEVSSLQLKIKKDMDSQMEKMFFVNLPVATRSEMDEVYKNLYDLKKMYRNLERMFSAEQNEEKTAKKTSKKK
jgi:polyhydroxyalkanoate synthase subunit PhaE